MWFRVTFLFFKEAFTFRIKFLFAMFQIGRAGAGCPSNLNPRANCVLLHRPFCKIIDLKIHVFVL